MAMILLIVVLFSVDKSFLGFNYIAVIPYVCFLLMTNYIGKLEKKADINKKVKIISNICFIVTVIIGLILILTFPEIFNTYHF